MWTKITNKIISSLDRYKYKTTTIFGRSIIVNTYVIPKLIYTINIFPPPPSVITEIKKHIRRFIFKSTIHAIKHTTLIQDKRSGGISLQDIDTKIKALRVKFVGDILQKPEQHPLAHYYIGLRISKLHKINNNMPHYFGSLPNFYKQCINSIKENEYLLNKNTKFIYTQLVKRQATPLIDRIKRGYNLFITDYTQTFANLHVTQIAPQSKEITYRLIYSMTPLFHKTFAGNRISKCALCKRNTQETEDHIFYKCKVVTPAIDTIHDIIGTFTTTTVDMYRAITLNIIPKTPRHVELKILKLLAEFRRLVWSCRLKAKFENRIFSPELFSFIFYQCTFNTVDDLDTIV
jgi:hypothetical protein